MTNDSVACPPTVTFWGATRNVSGSMHLIEATDRRILLDCGLTLGFAGRERNKRFPFAPDSLDAAVVTHAHVDHCGNLPNLVRQGFDGPIFCTPATRDLLAVILADSARIQQEDAAWAIANSAPDEAPSRALYTRHDAELAVERCVAVPYDTWRDIADGVRLRLTDAGHVLGSAMATVETRCPGGTYTVTFTGDLGRRGLPFLRPPQPVPAADLVISECTYGGRTHQRLDELSDTLAEVVSRTAEREGKILIPAFSLGRAQLAVYFLSKWMDEGRIPRIPIYVDSPLACDIAAVYRRHPEALTDPSLTWLESESSGAVRHVRSAEESRRLSTAKGPCVVVASGGMCETGRVLGHLRQVIDDPRCTIVLVSYQAPQSLGHRLMDRGPTVRFAGRQWNKWADVVDLNGFSGHADRDDFAELLGPAASSARRVRLVHGEAESADQLAAALRRGGARDVAAPERGELVSVA